MMYFIDRQVTIKRIRATSGDKTTMSMTATAVPCGIQTLDAGKTQFDAGMIGKTYRCWIPLNGLPIEQVKPADKLVVTKAPGSVYDNRTFLVRSVKLVDLLNGSEKFVECDLIEEDSS